MLDDEDPAANRSAARAGCSQNRTSGSSASDQVYRGATAAPPARDTSGAEASESRSSSAAATASTSPSGTTRPSPSRSITSANGSPRVATVGSPLHMKSKQRVRQE